MIIHVEEVLQTSKSIGSPQRINVWIGKPDLVPLGKRKHHSGFERALQMNVQLRFWQRTGEGQRSGHGSSSSPARGNSETSQGKRTQPGVMSP